MKKSLVQFLNNISTIPLLEENCFYVFTSDSYLCKYDLNISKIWEIKLATQHLMFDYEEFIFPYKMYSLIEKIEKTNGKKIFSISENIFPINILYDKLWVEREINGICFLASINLKSNEILNTCKIGDLRISKILSNQTFICFKNAILTCYSVINCSENWRLDFNRILASENVKVYANRFLIENNRIFCFLYDENWNKYAALIIDGNTGTVISDKISIGTFQYLHNGDIYSTSKYQISKLNTKTLEVIKTDLSDILKKENLIIQNEFSFFHKNLFYFAAKPGEGNIRSCVGRINLDTNNLEWWQEILKNTSKPVNNENRAQIQEIKANDHMLCVLCAGGDLYVFKIDEIWISPR